MTDPPQFLVHNDGDDVGVAVQDVEPGPVRGVCMDSDRDLELEAREAVPLGHKLALRDLAADAQVMEYGVVIGLTTQPIARGALVHVHNLRSARWQHSRPV